MDMIGVLVRVKPPTQTVKMALCAIPGVQVHAEAASGQLVVTLDESNGHPADTLSHIHSIEGVLSAAMVYQYSETEESL